jgi:hypothetical protein
VQRRRVWESGFVWDALGVVTGGDQKLPRELDADSEEFDQLWYRQAD